MRLVINEKYVPFVKTAGEEGLENSRVWARARERGQDYLYYVGVYDFKEHAFNEQPIKTGESVGGDFFNPTDVVELTIKTTEMKSIHDQVLESLNLQVGDLVKITHKVPSKNLGWGANWHPEMDEYIGQTGTINDVYNDGNGVRMFAGWSFPAHALELVSKAKAMTRVTISSDYDAKIYPGDRIEVGCQTIDKKTFEKIIKEFNK